MIHTFQVPCIKPVPVAYLSRLSGKARPALRTQSISRTFPNLNTSLVVLIHSGIEFGEHSSRAARRETLEETGQEIENERLPGITENIFTYNGIAEHEIVFICQAGFKNKEAYTSELKGGINAAGEEIKLQWDPWEK